MSRPPEVLCVGEVLRDALPGGLVAVALDPAAVAALDARGPRGVEARA